MTQTQDQPLTGFRVVDFGQYLAAPLLTMFLADYGADVIHVDPPEGPRWQHDTNAALYRNKRVVRLDLTTDTGRADARRLVEGADVVVENFRPGVMGRLGLAADSFEQSNPGLIWCSLPGFGASDPRAGVRAWEGVVMAAAGLYPGPGFTESAPQFTALPLASNFAAFVGLHRVAGALLGRLRDGRGSHIEVPLFDACFEAMGQHAELPESRDQPRALLHRRAPIMRTRRTADGKHLYFDTPLRGIQAFVDRYLPGHDLVDPTDGEIPELAEALDRLLLDRSAADWERIAQEELGSSVGVVQSTRDWLDDEHALASGNVVTVEDPELGTTRQAGFPVTMSATPARIRTPRRLPTTGAVDWRDQRRSDPPLPAGDLPLTGVRVLDAASLLAGPTCGRVLAQYGAEVVKLDRAGVIDEEPDMLTDDIGALCGSRTVSAGKRMLFLNLRHETGRELLDALLPTFDVVHHNFTAPAAERLGVGEAHLRELNPGVIVSRTTLHSPGGFRESFRGHDYIGQMVTGIGTRHGGSDSPTVESILVNDNSAGHLHAFGLMMALLHRHRTGETQRVTCSLSGTATMHQFPFAVGHAKRVWDEPTGTAATGWHPLHRLYRSADGWIFVAHPDLAEARSLLAAAGGPFAGGDTVSDAELADWVQARLLELPAHAAEELLRGAGLGAHRFVDLVELYTDPVVRDRDLLAVVDHPGIGKAMQVGFPLYGRQETPLQLATRRPGTDTLDLVAEAGFTDRLDQLLRERVIGVGENPDVNRTTVPGYWRHPVDRKPGWDVDRVRPVLEFIRSAEPSPSCAPRPAVPPVGTD